MTKEELEKEAEGKYCKGCKWRIEQCLWAWRKTNGLKEPNEKNCSCKEVPAYLAGAEFGYNKSKAETALLSQHILDLQKDKGNLTDRVRELEQQIEKMKNCKNCANYMISGKCPSFFRTGWCKNWEMTK